MKGREKNENSHKDSSIICPFDNLIRALTAHISKNFSSSVCTL